MFEVVGFYKFFKISYLKKNQKVLLEILNEKNIREFNSHISEDTRVEKLIIPLGDGMTVCRKL